MAVQTGAALRVSARWNGPNGQDIVNVFTFRTDFAAPQTDGDVVDGCDLYVSSIFQEFDADIVTTCTPEDIKVDVVEFIGGKWEVVQNVGFAAFGSTLTPVETANQLPQGAAAVAFLRTALGKHQGRKFFGGFSVDSLSTSGNLSSTVAARIATGVSKLLTPYVISASNTLVGVVLDQGNGTVRDILSIAVDVIYGYQRRRKPGVGS